MIAKGDLLISWMLSAFNVGLLAKDIYLYEDAYRIILKANEINDYKNLINAVKIIVVQ